MIRVVLPVFVLLVLNVPVRADEPADSAGAVDFDRDVAPLFAARCLSCHGGAEPKGGLDLSRHDAARRGGDSGAVLAGGQPAKSELLRRIEADEMPPKHPLDDAEKTVLRRWIAAGAKWGTDPIDPFRYTTDSRAGYNWWSLQPLDAVGSLREPTRHVTRNRSTDRLTNPIDYFIRAELADHDLAPSPAAERRTLIRRLTFGLTGLPPTPAEIAAFLADDRPDAYERLVDRLLASPRYGERWARHWLDVARFGESQGFERDKLRPNAWPYRDWLVQALNDDLPYDEFARLQLAGDVLRPYDPDAIAATGFLVAGPYDEVGQSQQSAAMRAVVRQDELEDVTSVVGQSFLGLTVHCARCHDHKFDPIRQSEYYAMTAALSGVRHGERTVARPTPPEVRERIERLQRRLDEERNDVLARIDAADTVPPRNQPVPLHDWSFENDPTDRVSQLTAELHGGASLAGGNLVVDGKQGYLATAPLTKSLTEKTLEVWVRLDDLDQRGGGAISVQTLDGRVFDAIVFGEQEPRRWMAGSNGFVRTRTFGGPAETEAAGQLTHVAIVYESDGTIRAYRNGRPYGKPYESKGPVTFEAGRAQIVFGVRHGPPGGNKMLAGAIHRARLYDRALSAEEVAGVVGVETDAEIEHRVLAALPVDRRAPRVERTAELARLRTELADNASRKMYVVSPKPPGKSHLLIRGNPATPGEVVTPGGVAAVVGLDADFELPADAPDTDRRIALANWITNDRNPLFARVAVNRLWHYHFGHGLVETPSDFGFNGGQPSHPELLDWLANELVRSGWSLKHVQRLIVCSETYRQTSRIDRDSHRADVSGSLAGPRPDEVDADNRLLWRSPLRRLEAEAVRDAILVVAGEINPRMYGPGYRDFDTYEKNSTFYEIEDKVGPAFNRRSLYRTWVRSGRSPFLDALDCPDPSTKTPDRAETTTPLQALAMANNSFVLRMADRTAERLEAESKDVSQRVRRLYEVAFGRPPSDEELVWTEAFVAEHGLAALVRVVFNGNEFLYVE